MLIHRVSSDFYLKKKLFSFVEYFSRDCLPSGNWSGFHLATCFYPDVLALLQKSYTRRPLEEREDFEKIIRVLRYVELAGLSISLTSILVSLFIFFTFK